MKLEEYLIMLNSEIREPTPDIIPLLKSALIFALNEIKLLKEAKS